MSDREEIVKIFSELRNFADNDIHPVVTPENWHVYSKLRDLIDKAEEDALTLLKEQQKTINALESDLRETLQVLGEKGGIVNELYDLLNETCKDFREATGDDNVCGLCHYEGCAYKGEEDWCGWCPGFDSNECFVMKNEIRKMAGKELLPDVDPQ